METTSIKPVKLKVSVYYFLAGVVAFRLMTNKRLPGINRHVTVHPSLVGAKAAVPRDSNVDSVIALKGWK